MFDKLTNVFLTIVAFIIGIFAIYKKGIEDQKDKAAAEDIKNLWKNNEIKKQVEKENNNESFVNKSNKLFHSGNKASK